MWLEIGRDESWSEKEDMPRDTAPAAPPVFGGGWHFGGLPQGPQARPDPSPSLKGETPTPYHCFDFRTPAERHETE